MTEEKRTHSRMIFSVPVTCRCFFKNNDRKFITVESVTLNVSDSGVCFYSDADLSVCSRIEIRPMGRPEEPPRVGRIMWCEKYVDTGLYHVGVSLQHEDLDMAAKADGTRPPEMPKAD